MDNDEIDDDELDIGSDASSQSNDVATPGITELIFSDEHGDDAQHGDYEDEATYALAMMGLLVKQKSERLAQDIEQEYANGSEES